MGTEKATYRSFLLRLWQVEQNGDRLWRCSLEETGTCRQRNFADLEALFGYLSAETNVPPPAREETKR
ncbi:MAG: hypothetical protein M9928_12965 [Anaerolineae bacterium]|nr:hypothetical protein [Anaerolineae bacterium]